MFRSEVNPHEGFPVHLAAARSPYADAWNEFDKLQKRAKQGGGAWWIHIVTNLLPLLGGGLFGLAVWKNHKEYVIAAFIGLVLLMALRARSDQRRFVEWPCPRCHAVWPGSKKEKDPACKVCGLRLHQLSS
jgi:hypothetical protein